MRRLNKKGSDVVIPPLIWIILGLLVVILFAWWINTSVKNSSNSTNSVTQCENQGKGAGCVSENEVDQKEDDGFTCTKGFLGCKEQYCCYKLFA